MQNPLKVQNQKFLSKKTKKRNQGLILNQQQQQKPQNVDQSFTVSHKNNKPANSRNETMSMSVDGGYVLTASRSKNVRPDHASSKSFFFDAYQTPGVYTKYA